MLLLHNLPTSTKRMKATAIIKNHQSGKSFLSLECNKIPTTIQPFANYRTVCMCVCVCAWCEYVCVCRHDTISTDCMFYDVSVFVLLLFFR